MAHYKNRRPKRYSGCCFMCSCQNHAGGLRTKRLRTRAEERAALAEREQRRELRS